MQGDDLQAKADDGRPDRCEPQRLVGQIDQQPGGEDAAVRHLLGRALFQDGRDGEAQRGSERCGDGNYQEHS